MQKPNRTQTTPRRTEPETNASRSCRASHVADVLRLMPTFAFCLHFPGLSVGMDVPAHFRAALGGCRVAYVESTWRNSGPANTSTQIKQCQTSNMEMRQELIRTDPGVWLAVILLRQRSFRDGRLLLSPCYLGISRVLQAKFNGGTLHLSTAPLSGSKREKKDAASQNTSGSTWFCHLDGSKEITW